MWVYFFPNMSMSHKDKLIIGTFCCITFFTLGLCLQRLLSSNPELEAYQYYYQCVEWFVNINHMDAKVYLEDIASCEESLLEKLNAI